MAVAFNTIPGNIRTPFFFAEINAGQNPAQFSSRLILVGQKLGTGSAAPNQPILMNNNEDVLFGAGSMLSDMYRVAKLNAAVQEVWCLPLDDDGAGVKASGTFTVGAAPAASGTVYFYVGGVRYKIKALSTDSVTVIAAAMVAIIAEDPGAHATATSALGVVTLTANHAGSLGNTIHLDLALSSDDTLTAEEILTIVQLSGGSGDPDMVTALANLGAEEFDFIGAPYADIANLDAIAAFLNVETGRWSYAQQLFGQYIAAKEGTLAALDAFGSGRNDFFTSIMGVHNSPSPIWRWAAGLAARAADHLDDPGASAEISRPLQTLDIVGVLAPKALADRWSINSRNILYYSGIAAYHVERDGTVSIDRLITTYQTNEWGSPDATWLDINTPAQITYFTRQMKAAVTQKHGRQALADENPSGNPGITTADDVKETIQFQYEDLVLRGVVENADLFYENLVVERDLSDPSRVNTYMPPDVVNQLRIVAVNVTTFLQSPQA